MSYHNPYTPPRKSATFDDYTLAEIRRAAATGIYDIRGAGTKRKVPHFDDLLFLGASISRYPLEGYREKCDTSVVLGARFAKKPIHLKTPITIAGMSFGALSGNAKEALGRGATIAGTSTTTGDGGMTDEERGHSQTLVYQYLPSRYGMNPKDLRRADAIEVVVGQGAKPGGGGMLLGQKISDRVANMRNLPKGIDQRSACRHPDWTGPDDLEIKILELREITDWEKPIYVKVGGARPYYDTALAVKAGADVVVLDGMQGGTAATQDVFIENVGMPTLACIRPAVQALQDLGMHRKVQLIISGGIRSGADVAKALALGADAVAIGTAALVAIGDNDPHWEEEYQKLGTTAGAYDDWHEGKDPAGITTQDPELMKRLDPIAAGRRLANYLKVMTLEAQTIARACGKKSISKVSPRNPKGNENDTGPCCFCQRQRHQIFHDQLYRPVRRPTRQAGPRGSHRRYAERRRRLCGLRNLARSDACPSRPVRASRCFLRHPAPLEEGRRMGCCRLRHGRSACRTGTARGAEKTGR
jgi:methylamine---glutamate N-methyltransferase subunit C